MVMIKFWNERIGLNRHYFLKSEQWKHNLIENKTGLKGVCVPPLCFKSCNPRASSAYIGLNYNSLHAPCYSNRYFGRKSRWSHFRLKQGSPEYCYDVHTIRFLCNAYFVLAKIAILTNYQKKTLRVVKQNKTKSWLNQGVFKIRQSKSGGECRDERGVQVNFDCRYLEDKARVRFLSTWAR